MAQISACPLVIISYNTIVLSGASYLGSVLLQSCNKMISVYQCVSMRLHSHVQ
eukprot:COSAG02_NODE_38242_length_431_cov_1.036145_2_plen_52_part_01